MNIGIIGTGNIGGNLAKLWARAGHKLYLSFSHEYEKLEALASQLGTDAKAATPYDAVYCSEVVVFSPPWRATDEALKQMGKVDGKIVVDTTNPYINDNMDVQKFDENDSASECNARKLENARVVKAFNTLRAQTLLDRSGQGLAIFYCSNDNVAKQKVAQLIRDAGFEPVDAGTLHEGKKQEPNTDRYLKELTREQAEAMVASATAK